jgi:hypothetical protein
MNRPIWVKWLSCQGKRRRNRRIGRWRWKIRRWDIGRRRCKIFQLRRIRRWYIGSRRCLWKIFQIRRIRRWWDQILVI